MNNPFAMRASPVPDEAAARLKADPGDVTVFAIIGMVIREKGVDRVIRAFRGVGHPHARLLVVGRGRDRARFERLARGDDRIVFWGEDRAIERVYAMTDYVIRGEATFAVGRTMYEGLYAGSEVIVPASPEDEVFDRERFADRIHTYIPGDERSSPGGHGGSRRSEDQSASRRCRMSMHTSRTSSRSFATSRSRARHDDRPAERGGTLRLYSAG